METCQGSQATLATPATRSQKGAMMRLRNHNPQLLDTEIVGDKGPGVILCLAPVGGVEHNAMEQCIGIAYRYSRTIVDAVESVVKPSPFGPGKLEDRLYGALRHTSNRDKICERHPTYGAGA